MSAGAWKIAVFIVIIDWKQRHKNVILSWRHCPLPHRVGILESYQCVPSAAASWTGGSRQSPGSGSPRCTELELPEQSARLASGPVMEAAGTQGQLSGTEHSGLLGPCSAQQGIFQEKARLLLLGLCDLPRSRPHLTRPSSLGQGERVRARSFSVPYLPVRRISPLCLSYQQV